MLGIGSHREAGKKGTALLPVTADRTLWTPLDSPDEYSLSPELIDNGNFNNNSSENVHGDYDWSLGTNWTVSNETLIHTAGAGGNVSAYPVETGAIASGGLYKLTYDLTMTAGLLPAAKVGNAAATTSLVEGIGSTTYLTAGTTSNYLIFIEANSTTSCIIDNISLKLVPVYTGQALEFDGVSDYLHFTSTAIGAALETSDTYTIAFWMNPDDVSKDEQMIFCDSGRGGFGILQHNSGILWYAKDGGGVLYNGHAAGYFSNGTWYRIVCIFDSASNKAYLYINNILKVTISDADIDNINIHSTNQFFIGAGYSGGAPREHFKGQLSDLQLYDVSWTASDVAYDYNNPEQLVLGNSGTSLTYSDLKLWYPMQDGHRGNQSFLLDGANIGPGTTILTNGDFSSGNFTGGNASHVHPVREVVSHDGHSTAAHITTSVAGGYHQSVLTSGQGYKISFDIKVISGSVMLGKSDNKVGGQDFTDSSWTSYSYIWTAGDEHLRVYSVISSTEFYIDNVLALPVNKKNHGTSVFYGDELITNGDMELNSNWTTSGGINTAQSTGPGGSSHGGTYSWKFEANSAYDGIRSDTYTTVTGRSYYYSVWVYPDDGTDIQLKRRTGGDSDVTLSTTALTQDQWNNITGTYVETSGGSAAYLDINSNNATSGVYYVDDVSVKEVGFATGWTNADGQRIIPQLGFQSYNQLAWFDGTANYVSIPDQNYYSFGDGTTSGDSAFSISFWVNVPDMTSKTFISKVVNSALEWVIQTTADDYLVFKLFHNGSGENDNIYARTTALTAHEEEWMHVVATYDGNPTNSSDKAVSSAGLEVYINGVNNVSVDDGSGGFTHMNATSADIYIGLADIGSGAQVFTEGCFTEASIWSEELTLAKVQELYNYGEALDALTHSSKDNLVGYWRNEENSTWTDLSTNGNNGTPNSITEYLTLPEGQKGRDTQGFLMNRIRTSGINLIEGSWGAISMGASSNVNVFASGGTVSLWIKPTGSSDNMGLINKAGNANQGWFLSLDSMTSNTWHLRFFAKHATTDCSAQKNNIISPDEWTYIAVTYTSDSGEKASLYKNGAKLIGLDTDTASSGSYTSDSLQTLIIGRKTGFAGAFNGQIDDVSIYTNVLTVPQIKRNYKVGKRRHKN